MSSLSGSIPIRRRRIHLELSTAGTESGAIAETPRGGQWNLEAGPQ